MSEMGSIRVCLELTQGTGKYIGEVGQGLVRNHGVVPSSYVGHELKHVVHRP